MTPEMIRMRCLALAIEHRAPNTKPEAIIEQAKLYETFVHGDGDNRNAASAGAHTARASASPPGKPNGPGRTPVSQAAKGAR